MSGKTITMSHAEIDRLSIIEYTLHRHITQPAAAKPLKLSVRQVKRLDNVFHIQNVNAYHQRLESWIRRFHGVATKHLEH
jgi:hypothetical protein